MSESIAIAALSARLLVEAARAGGYRAVALDLFGDADTRRAVDAWMPVGDPARLAIDDEALLAQLEHLAAEGRVAGWIAGSGFEAAPVLLARGAGRLPLFGNPPEVIAAVRTPAWFYSRLAALGIPHPLTTTARPAEAAGWLEKDAHSSGGWHVRPLAAPASMTASGFESVSGVIEGAPTVLGGIPSASGMGHPAFPARPSPRRGASGADDFAMRPEEAPDAPLRGRIAGTGTIPADPYESATTAAAVTATSAAVAPPGTAPTHAARTEEGASPGRYYQRIGAGEPLSALFLADGRDARILGVSRQIVRPLGGRPYVFRGCTGGVRLPPHVGRELAGIVAALAADFGLRGLNGLDFLLDGERLAVLELNPRPAASMALYGDVLPRGLVHAHLAACREGVLPASGDIRDIVGECRGFEVVFATRRGRLNDEALAVLDGLPWCHDRPAAPAVFAWGEPLCTVSATAADAVAVHDLLARRRKQIRSLMESIDE